MKNSWKNISIRNIAVLLAIPLIIVAIVGTILILEREKDKNNWIVCPGPQIPEYDVIDSWSFGREYVYAVYLPEKHDQMWMRFMARLVVNESVRSIVYFYNSKDKTPIIPDSLRDAHDIHLIIDYIKQYSDVCIAECSIYPDGSDDFIWHALN
jgi:hypothetical protein